MSLWCPRPEKHARGYHYRTLIANGIIIEVQVFLLSWRFNRLTIIISCVGIWPYALSCPSLIYRIVIISFAFISQMNSIEISFYPIFEKKHLLLNGVESMGGRVKGAIVPGQQVVICRLVFIFSINIYIFELKVRSPIILWL